MQAIGVVQPGGSEALQVLDLPEPHAGPGQVRIRVATAAVNPTDTALRAGWYGCRLQGPPPHIPGMGAAGVIDEVEEGAPWAVGDRVMAIVLPTQPTGGAYAEAVVVAADQVARIPEGVDEVAAATLPMDGLTAELSLRQLDLAAGATLGVTGAAGAYGGYVVQLGKVRGLRVLADAAEADEDLVRGLGADEVVRRGDDVADRLRAEVPAGVDGLADGAVTDAPVLPVTGDGGGLAVVRGWERPAERGITIHRTMVATFAREPGALDGLRRLAEEGALTLRVADVLPPERAAEAHRRLEAGGVRGRLVLTF